MNTIPTGDRLEIQQLSANYAFFCDTAQYGKIDALFTDDGVFDESILGMPVTRGRAGIRELFSATGTTLKFLIHLNSNHRITAYGGDTASGTSHLHAEGMFADGNAFRILGYYGDDYEKVAGIWLLKQRKLTAIAPLIGFPP